MKDNSKNVVMSIGFCLCIFGMFFLNILVEDKELSISERRKLKQFPKITIEKIFEGKLSEEIESYVMDQLVYRDELRSAKSIVNLKILNKKDNNGLFIQDNVIYKNNYPLSTKYVENVVNKVNGYYTKFFENNKNVYYTIVPDKNYFLSDDSGYLKIDYNELEKIMNDGIDKNIKYIDIKDTLSIEDYYLTDTHWKQECIKKVADVIAQNLGVKEYITTEYEEKEYGEFYGTLYGQLGMNTQADTIKYLDNDILSNTVVHNYEKNIDEPVYNIDKANESMDKYDIFLSGATPLIEISNPNSQNTKELVVFRDSYGSSLVPLLTEGYSKIIVVDTRYISPDLINNFVEFNSNQDVLFIYSTLLINESGSLK